MTLKDSVRKWVLINLPYDRSDSEVVSFLSGLDAHQLLVCYHNWMNRLIKPQSRRVEKSNSFERDVAYAHRVSLISWGA